MNINDYWLKYYLNRVCTLCGNWGIIDTRESAISPAGFRAGRINFCICPNGQALRNGNCDAVKILNEKNKNDYLG